MKITGKPYSGKPNVRFDEGELEIELSATTPALYSTEIIHIDTFGNLVSNIDQQWLSQFSKDRSFVISVGRKTIRGLKRGYWEGKKNEPIALFGSGGFLEISIREGNAQELLKVKRGDLIQINLLQIADRKLQVGKSKI